MQVRQQVTLLCQGYGAASADLHGSKTAGSNYLRYPRYPRFILCISTASRSARPLPRGCTGHALIPLAPLLTRQSISMHLVIKCLKELFVIFLTTFGSEP